MSRRTAPAIRDTESAAASGGADFDRLLVEIRACRVCAEYLPLGPRPVVRGRPEARLLIISQAPGIKVHQSGVSFDDKSGDRLRAWLGIDRATFYDESRVAIMPIGFCYPGSGKAGDLPPRPECAPLWHGRMRALLPMIELTLLVGQHAIGYYLPSQRALPIGGTIARWRDFLPEFAVLPHPSWHTLRWERDHPWFAAELLAELRARVAAALSSRTPRSAPCPRR